MKQRPSACSALPLLLSLLLSSGLLAGSLSEKLDSYLSGRAGRDGFSGAVLVAQRGETLLRQAYGMADYELKVPLAPDHIFRIGSLTKPFTATGVLLLVEEGKIGLQDSICTYLPSCPPDWSGVTIHQLLTHTSGLPNLFGDMESAPVKETAKEVERVLKEVEDTALRAKPGEVYAYNNFGYILLGYIIEKASGEYWEDFLRKRVFEPVGMDNTGYDDVWELVEGRAHGYELRDGVLSPGKYDDHSAYAAGGLRSTLDDLHKFQQALFSGKLLSQESLEKVLQPYVGHYGYGLQVTEFFKRAVYDHTGGIQGFASHLAYYPEEDLVVIVLSNVEDESARGTACDLAALTFGAPGLLGAETIALPPEAIESYVGEYQRDDGAEVHLSKEPDHLTYSRGDIKLDLLPIGPDLFVLAESRGTAFRFQRDQDGEVAGFSIESCGQVRYRAHRQ